MAFEVGKLYTFKDSEFEKSRESGKLVFKISNPASATPYIVKPFEFQIKDIPEKLICIYKANDVLEQHLESIIPEIYEVGKEYRFRVMRQDTKGQRSVSVRDDARGLTYYPIDLGKVKFERFQRIMCQVVSTDKGKLKLRYVDTSDDSKAKTTFSLDELLALRHSKAFGSRNMVRRLLENPMFDEANSKYRDGNPIWIITALEAMTHSISMWFTGRRHYRVSIVSEIRELALALIERSEYLNVFPSDERNALQERLSAVIVRCEDFLKAADLVADGRDVEFITATLNSLKTTGWLYKPENKMRLLMAVFTLRKSYINDYIWEIFKIIRDNHADPRFLKEFARSFITMLEIFIDTESSYVNTTNRDSIRALIEALAIELLLTRNTQFDRWNFYRGRLYTLTILIVGRAAPELIDKALRAFTENLDMDLEFSWHDLDDVNRLCHANLSQFAASPGEGEQPFRAFEGKNARLWVHDGEMSVLPPVTGPGTRRALTFPLAPGCNLTVDINGKPGDVDLAADRNLSKLHSAWRDLEKVLFDPNQNASMQVDVKIPPRKSVPAIDDEVIFRIDHPEENDLFTFGCVIEDPLFEGEGIINTRDIVIYPVKPPVDTFWNERGQMLFRGRVIEQLPDGRFRFSMDRELDAEIMRVAKGDRDSGDNIEAVVTKDNGTTCLAVTDGGYAASVYKNGTEVHQGDKIFVTVSDVSMNKKNGRPFIVARCEGLVPDNDSIRNYADVPRGLHFILEEFSGGQVYVPAPPVVEEVQEEEAEKVPDIYLSDKSVAGLSRFFDALAFVTADNLTRTYTLLAAARLLALLSDDTYRAQFIEIKQRLVEELSHFAAEGRVSTTIVAELQRRVSQFPTQDVDLSRRMEILNILDQLDTPTGSETLHVSDPGDTSMLAALRRLVLSYNLLRGLRQNDVRRNIKLGIYNLLSLPLPDIDVSRVDAREDQHHEFKESLFYPAGNAMQVDEKAQAQEIAEVICGMLNSEGGTLYIGVTNAGVPRGLQNDFIYLNNGFEEYDLSDVQDKFALRFCKMLRDYFGLTVNGLQVYPSLVALEFDEIDGHCFAVITVRPFPGLVRLPDGSVFTRQDSSTLPIKKKSEQASLEANRKKLA